MSKQSMNGGEIVVATLLSRGIEAVFFVPGGTFTTVLESLSRHRNEIRSVPTRLESAATFAAEAYSAVARKPAAAFVTRAPGAANAAIGVHNAMQSSRPMVLFIAQPTTRRDQTSTTTARYSQPWPVRMYVTSPTQTWRKNRTARN